MNSSDNVQTAAYSAADTSAEPEQRVRDRRWLLLCVLASAQLMVVLDNTIVNVALPAVQADLGFSQSGRTWVVTAYSLTFGSLLLLGGRLSDLLGRKRAFITGLAGFAAASAVGGAATDLAMLIIARAVQGAFGAVLAPSVLSLISQTFPSGRSRTRAFSILGVIVASGAAVGLVLGGLLTEYANWRWTMYVNVAFAAAALIGAGTLLDHEHGARPRPRIDLLGAVLAGLGLLSLVYGLALAENGDWLSDKVLGTLVAGPLVLVGFVWRQRATRFPLLPLSILRNGTRAGAYINRFTSSTGNFAAVFFLTFFLQGALGLSPVLAGLGITPMIVGNFIGSGLSATLTARLGARWMSVIGLLAAAAALWWLSGLTAATSYWSGVPAPLVLFGVGQGVSTSVGMNAATQDLPTAYTGVASALVSVMQQLGGSIGTALLSSIAASSAAAYAAIHSAGASAEVHGYDTAFLTAAAIFITTAVACGILIRGNRATGNSAGI